MRLFSCGIMILWDSSDWFRSNPNLLYMFIFYTSFCFLTKVLFSCSCNPLIKYFITTCLSFRVSWMPWQIFFDEVSEGACQVAASPPSSVWLISRTSPRLGVTSSATAFSITKKSCPSANSDLSRTDFAKLI